MIFYIVNKQCSRLKMNCTWSKKLPLRRLHGTCIPKSHAEFTTSRYIALLRRHNPTTLEPAHAITHGQQVGTAILKFHKLWSLLHRYSVFFCKTSHICISESFAKDYKHIKSFPLGLTNCSLLASISLKPLADSLLGCRTAPQSLWRP